MTIKKVSKFIIGFMGFCTVIMFLIGSGIAYFQIIHMLRGENFSEKLLIEGLTHMVLAFVFAGFIFILTLVVKDEESKSIGK